MILGCVVLAGGFWLLSPHIEAWVADNEQRYAKWLNPDTLQQNLWLLLPTAFFGGLISSLSPCILALVPVNLSYIGTLKTPSKVRAFVNALAFVLGVVVVLSMFGLVSSFAGLVIVEYKGYVNTAVGLVSIVLGLGVLGLFKMKIPTFVSELPSGAAPFIVGATFALVTSPCASPVLLSMLLIAGSTGNTGLSVTTMVLYALGYTFILLVASVANGVVKKVGALKQFSKEIT